MRASSIANPIRSFQSRLNRVAEARAPIDAEAPDVSVLPDWKRHFIGPFSAVFAVLIGALAVVLARTIRINYVGGSFAGADPNMTLLLDVGVALVIAVFVCFLLRLRSGLSMVGQFAGVAAMVVGMHNAAHFAPGAFGVLFSDDWADEIVAASEPRSAFLLGDYITLSPEVVEVAEEGGIEEEPVMPRIIRLQ